MHHAVSLLLSILLACAAPPAPRASLADVRAGMTLDEVVRLLGEPLERRGLRCGPGSPLWLVYEGSFTGPAAARSTVTLVDGKVTHVVRRGEGLVAPPTVLAGCGGGPTPGPARTGEDRQRAALGGPR